MRSVGANRDGNVNVRFSAADFTKDQALCLKRVTPNVTVESRLYRFADDWQALFHMPGEVKIGRTSIGRKDFSILGLIEGIKTHTELINAKRIVVDPVTS